MPKAKKRKRGSPLSYTAELADGRRIRFNLKQRKRDPHYFACFRGPDHGRKERSTHTDNLMAAQTAAVGIIRHEYDGGHVAGVSWDDAVGRMVEAMQARQLRQTTIDQYLFAIKNLRKAIPSDGPANITPDDAERFKAARIKKVSARTVAGNLSNMSIVFHWFRDVLRIVEANPFEAIKPPKLDAKRPRIISPKEEKAFHTWLAKRWDGWRMPLLFLEVKAAIGCRIGELTEATTKELRDGRLYFSAETTKGRRDRACLLSPALFKELRKAAGPVYVFERFSEQLRGIYVTRDWQHHANGVKGFTPARLKKWLQKQTAAYLAEHPDVPRFKLHNLRGTAMSKARMAGVGESDAAVAFGCDPRTMQKHYMALDAVTIGDRVFTAMRKKH